MATAKKKKRSTNRETPFDQQSTAPTQPPLAPNKFPVAKHAGGRPSTYSLYVTGIICARITEGESLRAICRDDGMPSLAAVFTWLQQHREFAEQYARAVENRVETHVEEIYEIADDSRNDYVERQRADGSTFTEFDSEHVQRSRLRIDVRKWAASKMKPKKYGEIITQKHTGPAGDDPIQIASITIRAEDLAPDARETLRQALLTARQAETEDQEDED